MSFTDIENLKNYISILDPSILPTSECNYYTEQEFNELCLNNLQKGALNISFFHINIRSLNANHSKLIQLLATLNHNFDAIVLSEIWAFNISFYKHLLKDYNFYYFLPANSNIGGIGIYVHHSFSVIERNDLTLNATDTGQAVESLFLELYTNYYHCLLCGIYRHPSSNLKKFTYSLEKFLDSSHISNSISDIFFIGDINADLLSCDTNHEIANYIDVLFSHNCIPLIILPTRFSDTSATILDHIYLKAGKNSNPGNLNACLTGNITTDITDHLANFLIMPLLSIPVPVKLRPLIRVHSPTNTTLFQNSLNNCDWSLKVTTVCDTNTAYDNFVSILDEIYNKCFPLTRVSRKCFKNKKWVTKEVKKSSEIKNRLYKKWIISKNLTDKTAYKNYVNIF